MYECIHMITSMSRMIYGRYPKCTLFSDKKKYAIIIKIKIKIYLPYMLQSIRSFHCMVQLSVLS